MNAREREREREKGGGGGGGGEGGREREREIHDYNPGLEHMGLKYHLVLVCPLIHKFTHSGKLAIN